MEKGGMEARSRTSIWNGNGIYWPREPLSLFVVYERAPCIEAYCKREVNREEPADRQVGEGLDSELNTNV